MCAASFLSDAGETDVVLKELPITRLSWCDLSAANIWRSLREEPLPLPAHHPGHPGEVPGWGESAVQTPATLRNRKSPVPSCCFSPSSLTHELRLCCHSTFVRIQAQKSEKMNGNDDVPTWFGPAHSPVSHPHQVNTLMLVWCWKIIYVSSSAIQGLLASR